MATSTAIFQPPAPLKMGTSIASDWERFYCEWQNYQIVADLAEVAEKKRVAMFLASTVSEAHTIFRTFKFENEADKTKLEKIVQAFKKHCVGEVNVTYERYIFHQRVQQTGESFDDFFADL